MKKIIIAIALLIPCLAKAQCLDYFNTDINLAKNLKAIVEQYTGSKLTEETTSDFSKFRNENNEVVFRIDYKTSLDQTQVKRIYIKSTDAVIDKMVKEYFAPKTTICDPRTTSTYIMWPSGKLVYLPATEKGKKYIEIEKNS